MALIHLLYRCPSCGHDPMVGQGDEATCPACATRYRRGPGSAVEVRVGGEVTRARAADLVDALRAAGGPRGGPDADGTLLVSSAMYRGVVSEQPVRSAGRLQGWFERPGPPRRGRLEVDQETLRFRHEGGGVEQWPLLDIMALQVSTSSLQIGIRRQGTVQVTLLGASSFRWEELLQELIQEAWSRAGRGTILEFQPRVTAR